MNDLSGRGPLGQKESIADSRDYLGLVVQERCCICEAFGLVQMSPTQAHHPICGRYGTRRVPHVMAVPLCEGHHLGMFDTSKIAIHRERKLWVSEYGPDTDWVAPTQDKLFPLLCELKSIWKAVEDAKSCTKH